MIAILGFILYGLVGFAVWKFDTIGGMVDQAMLLAPQLSIGMFALYFYPLILASVLFALRKSEDKHRELLTKQTNIAASVAVSLGLIGTFQGLTQMVSSIAASMGGDGDITEKMGSMINAISDALGAMSYAFLTSILGVAVSVLLILSLNFWTFHFKQKQKKQLKDETVEVLEKVVAQLAVIKAQHSVATDELVKFAKSEESTQRLVSALEQFVATQTRVSDEFKVSNRELAELIQSNQSKFTDAQVAISRELSTSKQDLLELVTTSQANHDKKINEMSEIVLNEIGKIEELSEKSLDLSIEQKFILSDLKDDVDAERTRFKSTLKALAE